MTSLSLPDSAPPPTFDTSLKDASFAPKFKTVEQSNSSFGGTVQWVGNATTILTRDNMTFMTDPNFLHSGDHVHLGPGVTGTRVKDPAFDYAQCPPVDFILLSHLHADHFDQLVEEKLRRDIPIISTPHACEHLKALGFTELYALQTWEEIKVSKGGQTIKITAMPAKHTIGPFDKVNELLGAIPPVMGSIVRFDKEGGDSFNLYISGDTLYYDDLKEIRKRHPHIHLALVHLGGTTLPIIHVLVTMDGEQGMKLLCTLKPDTTIPIHFDDYDVFKSPLSDFQKLVEASEFKDRVVYLDRGQSYRW